MKNILIIAIGLAISSASFAERVYAKWYRYDNNGVPQVSNNLTQEHIKNGYEALDKNFRVIKTIPPYNAQEVQQKKEAEEKAQQEAEVVNTHKKKIFERYDSSERAERKRIELMENINSKRQFAQQQISVAENELKQELDKAAGFEKNGKPVSKALKENITKKKEALAAKKTDLSDLIKQQYAELNKLTEDIRELRRFEIVDSAKQNQQ